MDRMLTKHDVDKIVGQPVKIVLASELHNKSSIADVLGDNNKALILYDYDRDGNTVIGHWCALLLNRDGLSFYDPYGKFIDDSLSFVPDEYKKYYGRKKNELTRLMYHSPFKNLHYNPHCHQNVPNSSTCGRHCALFLKNELEPEKYNDRIQKASKELGKKTDEVAYIVTKGMLGY
jgi:hypothetical protein